LYVLTGDLSFDATAFYCLAAGLLFMPPTILTGLFTHWLNFPGELHRPMGIERRLSLLLLTLTAGAFAWRWADPGVLTDLGGIRIVYLLLVLALTPLVTATSYFGGMLSFPLGAPPPAIWFPENPGRRPAPPG
jgi:uncharacterized membrane protein